MKLLISLRAGETQSGESQIVFVQNKKPLLSQSPELEQFLTGQITKTGFSGEYAQTLVFPTFGTFTAENIILVGLGSQKSFRMEYLERAASAAIRAGRKVGITQFTTRLPVELPNVSEPALIHAVTRGAAWGFYDFTFFKTDCTPDDKTSSFTLTGSVENSPANQKALAEAETEYCALIATADLANLPGNEATPQKIADWAQEMAKHNALTFSSLNKEELKKENCNALLAVAAGSAQDAKIITLKYAGTKPEARPIVLIGKTITFDTGGISLKPGKNMEWMRYDKCGGMAVLAAMQMIAQLKPETPVIGMLAVAENMPGGSATRPGDIIRSRAGKTIEIINTDAEGRLVLADALSLAQQHNPAVIVDLATLTGAVITALGHTAAAVIGNRHELNTTLVQSAEAAGERLWELPLWPENMDEMKGTFSDLQNMSKSGTAGTMNAAAFLANFVPDDIPWAHLDIAGTAWEESPKPWMNPGATIFGARTLIEWIKGL